MCIYERNNATETFLSDNKNNFAAAAAAGSFPVLYRYLKLSTKIPENQNRYYPLT